MPAPSYSIRNYTDEDFEKFVKFCLEAKALGMKEDAAITSLVNKKFRKPHYSPDQHLFLAFWKEQMVGFLDIVPEMKIGRIILDGFVHHHHRRKGLATQLHHNALKRAERAGAEVLHVCIPENDRVCTSFLKKLSFSPVRRFFDLEVSLSELPHRESFLRGARLQHFKGGEEDRLAIIQNRCFAGSWGFCPNTEDEIKFYLEWTGSKMRDVMATEFKEDGSIIGYCWTHRVKRGASSKKRGRIHMFGVIPEYRGKRLGKMLLLHGLQYLRRGGSEVAELTVDSQNRPAQRIYQSFGFRPLASKLWFEKKI
jgi:mycothiol synthase